MAIEFVNPITAGVTLIREAIQSQNFSNDAAAGVTGWQIAADGSATFYNITIGSDNYFIDENGNAAFNDVNVNGDLFVDGENLFEILDDQGRGLQYWASRDTDSDTTVGTTELAVLTLGTEMEDGRMYRISTSNMRINGTVAGDVFSIRLRDGGASAPTTTSNVLTTAGCYIPVASNPACSIVPALNIVISCDDDQSPSIDNLNSGTHNLLLSIVRASGTGVGTINTSSSSFDPIQIMVEDVGPLLQNTGVDESGSGGSTPVQTYTTTYNATWSATYQQSGTRRPDAIDGDKQYQGFYSSNNGNQKALIGFDYSSIQSDLSGATVTKCEVYLYFNHWYFNAGGTAVIGTHDNTTTANNGPSTYPTGDVHTNRKQVSGWGINVGKWVDLGTTIGNEFKSGASLGIAMGPGPSTSQTYYGSYDGDNMTNEPKLRITYTK